MQFCNASGDGGCKHCKIMNPNNRVENFQTGSHGTSQLKSPSLGKDHTEIM